MNCKEMIEHISKRITTKSLSVSLDGSSFDSSQFTCLHYVDIKIYDLFEQVINDTVDFNISKLKATVPHGRADELKHAIKHSWKKTNNHLFMHMPNVNSP